MGSNPKTTTCEKTSDGEDDDTYDLTCTCENDKLETPHALAGIVDSDDDAEIAESTQTSNGIFETKTTTKHHKASVIGTSTSTTLITSTKTRSQGTATVTQTSVVDVTTTTVYAVAPTGRIRVDDDAGKVSMISSYYVLPSLSDRQFPSFSLKGFLGNPQQFGQPLTFVPDANEYDVILFKTSPNDTTYSLALVHDPSQVLGLENVFPGNQFGLDGKDNAYGTLQSMNLPFGNAKGNQGGKVENSIWSLGSPSPNTLNPDRKTQVLLESNGRRKERKDRN